MGKLNWNLVACDSILISILKMIYKAITIQTRISTQKTPPSHFGKDCFLQSEMVILNTRPIRTNMDKIFNFCSCDCIKVDFRRYFMVWICINTQKFFLHWMQTFKLHVHVQRIKLFIIFKIMINFLVFCNLIFKARSSVFERGEQICPTPLAIFYM